ncbi:hypothetical protein L6452_40973 [Arctium lappa]|uniref:Uncharacterized protein n=1 Tax=Arctium lappa TaxID=4217 RepID=A0ACB8XPC3_ARCLA|nr:hypothetical protein L6452_40973 [Arctium lappa]
MCGLQTSQETTTPPSSTIDLMRLIASQVNSSIQDSHDNVQRLLKTVEEMRTNPNVSIPPLQNPQPIDVDAIIAAMATRQPQQPSNDIEDDHDDDETNLRDD